MAKSPLDRLASLGEEVLGKASQNPTAAKVLHSAMQLKDRVDDLSKRVRGLEAMEKRIVLLEKRISKLEYDTKKKPAPANKPAGSAKTTTARKSATAKKN